MILALAAAAALLAAQEAEAPDFSDPFNRAIAQWAECAGMRIDVAAWFSRRRDMSVIDDALAHCTAEEAALRALLREQGGREEGDRAAAETRAALRETLFRHLRRQRRR